MYYFLCMLLASNLVKVSIRPNWHFVPLFHWYIRDERSAATISSTIIATVN